MAKAKYIPFFASWVDVGRKLPQESRLEFYETLLDYGFDGKEPEGDGEISLLFTMAKPALDKAAESRENGAKGGRPRKPAKSGGGAANDDDLKSFLDANPEWKAKYGK